MYLCGIGSNFFHFLFCWDLFLGESATGLLILFLFFKKLALCFIALTVYFFFAAAAKLLQPCLTLCDPIDGSPPGSSVPGILQARTREWVAISFSNAWKWKVKVKLLSPVRLLATPWTAEVIIKLCCLVTKSCSGLCNPMDCNLPGSSVHGIFQARILEWVAISFSRGSSQPRDQTHVSYKNRQSLYHWATREVPWYLS